MGTATGTRLVTGAAFAAALAACGAPGAGGAAAADSSQGGAEVAPADAGGSNADAAAAADAGDVVQAGGDAAVTDVAPADASAVDAAKDAGIDAAADGADAALDGVADSAKDAAAVCPDAPSAGKACAAGLQCSYGKECCCGTCKPSMTCNCSDGTFACLYTDACLGAAIQCPDAGDAGATDAQDAGAGCPPPQPAGTVCEGTLWVCAPGFFKPYGSTACLEATCANMQQAVSGAIAAAAAAANSCSTAEDCVQVSTSTACAGSCGTPVNGGQQNDVIKVVGWVDDNICKPQGYAAKCGYSTPKCMAPKFKCEAGKCAWAQ